MPKATKKSNHVSDTYASEGQEEFSKVQEASSDNELQEEYKRSYESCSDDPEVFFNPQPSTSHKVKEKPNMNVYMPYIEGPAIDWTVNDGLYNRFLKWKLKCEKNLRMWDDSLVRWFWSRPIHLKEPAKWRSVIRNHIEEIWRILQAPSQWAKSKVWFMNKLQTSWH